METFGAPACLAKDEARRKAIKEGRDPGSEGACIPAYRTAGFYLYNIVTSAWLGTGALCIGRYTNLFFLSFFSFSFFSCHQNKMIRFYDYV